MGRPPSNGLPSFRFNSLEVAEMEALLEAHDYAMPSREILDALAEKFSLTAERSGKFVVQMKQVWHWFQNRRYAVRAKASRPLTQDDSSTVTNMPQAPQSKPSPQAFTDTAIDVTEGPQTSPESRNGADSNSMEFEAKSARDGAWYDVAMFLSHRSVNAQDPEVLVRFAGFGAEEDEWVDIGRLVRKRSLPCESSECVAVLQGDLILCFQEGKDQALYYDAHVLDAQRRRHDVRGCRCRFLVRYDHDQSEEIVPLRKVCRRPETDYRLQQLYASNEPASANQSKAGAVPCTDNTLRVYPPVEPVQKQRKIQDILDNVPAVPGTSQTNLLVGTEIKAEQTDVDDIADAGTIENSGALQSNDSPQPEDLKTDSPSMEISDAGDNSLQPQVLKIESPSAMEVSDAGNNSLPPQVIKVSSPVTMETSDAGNSSLHPEVMENVGPSTTEISDAGGVQQPKVTEITNVGDLDSLNASPTIVMQQEVAEIVSDADLGNSPVPHVNDSQENLPVAPQSEIEETSGSSGSENIPLGAAA
ncbi:protein SAWADEE HOMEODOMAIN HOMOLOG 2-like isoform X1 [Daucus carota subsp. sativus]|uniref:protein SAWADEE HOMEODOMAIN HOMOLOG 2-like isoform X1 n=1 Tax=Daucus carota subsp. sativus TaxID=79200 RepID=UPI0007EFCF70|nr:PREDICTED: protein SAWADEE HOMEODOMAIN HOMOLOG 2-like isoform X1 [Daucus carota subsp. sativus]